MPASSSSGRPASRSSSSTRSSPSRRSSRSPRWASPTPTRSPAADRDLDWSLPPEENLNRIRALSPHIGARGLVDGRRLIVWRARPRPAGGDVRGGRHRAARGAEGRRPPHARGGVPPRPAQVTPPARVAARVVERVFEEGAYADRAFRGAAERLDARDRAFAQQLAYGTVQRVRTLDHGDRDARAPAGAQARPARARRAAHRGLPARLHGRRPAARGRARDGGARARGRARARRRLHERGHAAPGGGAPGPARPSARGDARRGGAPALLPRLDRRGLVAGARARRRRALMRAQNEPPETAVRTPDGPLRRRRDSAGVAGERLRVAAEPRARSSPARPWARARASGSSTSARRPAGRRRSWRPPAPRSSPSRSIRAGRASWRRTRGGSARR